MEGIIFARGLTPLNDGNEDATDTPEECCALCKNTPGIKYTSHTTNSKRVMPNKIILTCMLKDAELGRIFGLKRCLAQRELVG